MMHLSLHHPNIGLEISYTSSKHRIQNRICNHDSHTKSKIISEIIFGTEQKFSLPKHGDFMWPTPIIQIPIKPHGYIPDTLETHTFVNLVINGTLALHMIGLGIMELYNEILKHMVPSCYNLWKLIEKIHGSMIRVRNPHYMRVIKARSLNSTPRKATPADFGIVPPRGRTSRKSDIRKNRR
jgi:hypothetical protein